MVAEQRCDRRRTARTALDQFPAAMDTDHRRGRIMWLRWCFQRAIEPAPLISEEPPVLVERWLAGRQVNFDSAKVRARFAVAAAPRDGFALPALGVRLRQP
jgi:hypothetical protein